MSITRQAEWSSGHLRAQLGAALERQGHAEESVVWHSAKILPIQDAGGGSEVRRRSAARGFSPPSGRPPQSVAGGLRAVTWAEPDAAADSPRDRRFPIL